MAAGAAAGRGHRHQCRHLLRNAGRTVGSAADTRRHEGRSAGLRGLAACLAHAQTGAAFQHTSGMMCQNCPGKCRCIQKLSWIKAALGFWRSAMHMRGLACISRSIDVGSRSTGEVHAKVLQNLRVLMGSLCLVCASLHALPGWMCAMPVPCLPVISSRAAFMIGSDSR